MDKEDNENQRKVSQKRYTRYVTLDDSQKIVKVFESNQSIEPAIGSLYQRNKDENGKLSIKLVDLMGNIHCIKERGKYGEKNLREKTFGPRGRSQLKVVYKNKEPVYALFYGSEDIPNQEFCTAEELRDFFEAQMQNFKRFGWRMEKDSCFMQMKEVIQKFNESFMKGNFVPSISENSDTNEEPSLKNLSEELAGLDSKEQEARALMEKYESMLPSNGKGEI